MSTSAKTTTGHLEVAGQYTGASHITSARLRARRVASKLGAPCDEAQIECYIQTTKRGSTRVNTAHHSLMLEPLHARQLANAIAPELVAALHAAVVEIERLRNYTSGADAARAYAVVQKLEALARQAESAVQP